MPNGGSDCCGTCWFNARNQNQAGYGHADSTIPAHCTIRDLPIESPFYTYCANHPHRCRERTPIPIGPVYTGDSSGHRVFWQPSPDTEEIRARLLKLLTAMLEQPATEYPIGIYRDEMVIWQLGEFQEKRAVTELQRITSFDPNARADGPFVRTRQRLVALAREALAKIQAGSGEPGLREG